MMRKGWVLLATLATGAGCAQVLGLDSYGPAPEDAGYDAPDATSMEGGADASAGGDGSADHEGPASDATVDAGDEAFSGDDSGGDSGDDLGEDAGDTSGEDAGDGSAEDSGEDSGDGSSREDAPAPDASDGGPAFDAPAEATIPTDASDAAPSQDGSCTGSATCAPTPPPGWTGPLSVWLGPGAAPPCAAGFHPVFDGGANPSAPSAECACSCGKPGGVSCGPVALSFAKHCSGGCGSNGASLAQGAACLNIASYENGCPGGSGMIGVSASGSTASGGSCTPQSSTTLPAWAWGAGAVACAPASTSAAGCGAGEVCVPTSAPPFGSRPCILQQGSLACPPGEYSLQSVYYGGVQDSRGCSTCSCGSVSGVDCNANAHVQVLDGCGGQVLADIHPLPASCTSPGGSPNGATFTTTPSGGSCGADGGVAHGTVAQQNPVTICCIP
jgi:hypothetical protein